MAGYIMSFAVMNKVKEKGFEKWTELAASIYKIVVAARDCGRTKNIIFNFHSEKGEDGMLKIKTAGKLLDNTVNLDGLFTYIFNSEIIKDEVTGKISYKFRTHSDGTTTAKTPVGCFKEDLIPNDMGYVIKMIEKFNNGE